MTGCETRHCPNNQACLEVVAAALGWSGRLQALDRDPILIRRVDVEHQLIVRVRGPLSTRLIFDEALVTFGVGSAEMVDSLFA